MIQHGSHKPLEEDDPYALVGCAVPAADLEYMAECLVEEFAGLGWPEEEIERMFFNPFYQSAYQYFLKRGKPAVRELVRRTLGRGPATRSVAMEFEEEPETGEETNYA